MKVQITVTTEDGETYEGEIELTAQAKPKKRRSAKENPKPAAASRRFDFTLPLRAFVTTHGARKLSGPQKFVLLVAALAKGDTTVPIDNSRVQREWNRMTEPMGGKFNAAYPTRAQDKGWVESPKRGAYKLRASWSGALPS